MTTSRPSQRPRQPLSRQAFTSSGLLLGAFVVATALSACGDKAAPTVTAPTGVVTTTAPGDAQAIARSVPGAEGDPSVPAASAALTGSESQQRAGQDKPENAPQGGLSKAEESSAMPMPGQANNHSTPAAKPAGGSASR